jgi:hypothetical protein
MAEKLTSNEQSLKEFLFEPTSQELWVGKAALSDSVLLEYVVANQREAELFTQTVANPDLEIEAQRFPRSRFAGWEMDDYKTYGRWLLPLASEHNPELTHHVALTRSYQLGAGPSRDRIIDDKRFGSVANFVKAVGLVPKVRYGKYDDWEFDDFVSHIKNVVYETGSYKITQGLLWDRINEDGKDEPSPAVIRTKTGDLSAVFKAAGIRSKVRLTDAEYKQIILSSMLDNDGREPTAGQLDQLSRSGKSHSTSTLIKHYGSLTTLKAEAAKQYDELRTKHDGRQIKAAIETGEVPLALFKGASSGSEIMGRFKRFKAIGLLASLTGKEAGDYINLCIIKSSESEFLVQLRKRFPTIRSDVIASLVTTASQN